VTNFASRSVRPAPPRFASAFATQSASSEDEYRQESAYWYSGLPDSATLSLTVSWPEIGLPTTAAVLEVPNLATLARGALPLL